MDCISGHIVDSNESNLLKIVDNDARINEYKHVYIASPQYFPVIRNHINSINIRIINGYDMEDLLFNTETSVTLHFKCHST